MNSEIRVTEIRLSEQGQLIFPEDQHGVDLGGRYDPQAALVELQLDSLMQFLKDRAERVYLLFWQGDKVPSGAVIDGRTIAWTKNGKVSDGNGGWIGVYDRIVEYGGESGLDQQMIVYPLKSRVSRSDE